MAITAADVITSVNNNTKKTCLLRFFRYQIYKVLFNWPTSETNKKCWKITEKIQESEYGEFSEIHLMVSWLM